MFTQLSFSFSVTGSMIQIALEKIIKAVTRFLKYCLKSNNTQNVSHSLSPLTTVKNQTNGASADSLWNLRRSAFLLLSHSGPGSELRRAHRPGSSGPRGRVQPRPSASRLGWPHPEAGQACGAPLRQRAGRLERVSPPPTPPR